MNVSVDPVLLKSNSESNNYICSYNNDQISIQTIAINREKNLLVVGGRREFRVLELSKEPSKDKDIGKKASEYSMIDEKIKYSSRKRTSLDYGICDV